MNFIFFSPNYPHNYWNFCSKLRENGVNVLGIGDAPYSELQQTTRDSMTEYYHVDNLSDYDQVYRAVAFFAYKYGKIDWIESMNDFWLEQDSRLRTDFNIKTGLSNEDLMKFRSDVPDIPYTMEQYPEDELCSYDSICDSQSEPLFESLTVWPAIQDTDCCHEPGSIYYTCPEIPARLRSLAHNTLKKLNLRSRFTHLEFLHISRDNNLGKAGSYVLIKADMCPVGGYIPDMMNYAHSVNVYKIWADMITTDRRYFNGRLMTASELSHISTDHDEDHFCVYASRNDNINYLHPTSQLNDKYHDVIVYRRVLKTGYEQQDNQNVYIVKLRSKREINTFLRYAHQLKTDVINKK